MYLRGDATDEGAGIRRSDSASRTSSATSCLRAGVCWSPAVPLSRQPRSALTGTKYSDFIFRNSLANRTPMVYVGANDGMLHAFNANSDRREMLAFVPGTVFRDLIELTKPSYAHQYYVDGSPTLGDAFFGTTWHTMLVGGLNKGGQGFTRWTSPTRRRPLRVRQREHILKWEFNDTNDADLGYTLQPPRHREFARHDGRRHRTLGRRIRQRLQQHSQRWHRQLHRQRGAVHPQSRTGNLVAKIDTGVGTAQGPAGETWDNGLATPALVDIDADASSTRLRGRLVRQHVEIRPTRRESHNWKVAYSTGTPVRCSRQPMRTARRSRSRTAPKSAADRTAPA